MPTIDIHDYFTLHATAALIETLGLAPCLLVGSSGGAAITVEVAARHGHLLRGAVFSELRCSARTAPQAGWSWKNWFRGSGRPPPPLVPIDGNG